LYDAAYRETPVETASRGDKASVVIEKDEHSFSGLRLQQVNVPTTCSSCDSDLPFPKSKGGRHNRLLVRSDDYQVGTRHSPIT
jgi:hypothetical protein